MDRQFLIYSIDALDLIYNQNLNQKLTKNEYTLDLTNGRPLSVTIERRDDNALFHQMCLMAEHDFSNSEPDERFLTNSIVIMDFSRIFIKMSMEGCNIEKLFDDIHSNTEDTSWGAHLYRLLDSKIGISIKFSSKEKAVRFIPFDKSASMAKKSRITYIRKDLKETLDKRLCLDIDFSKMELPLSKYYAYRGLYLTSGKRVDFENQFELNEDTVIVLPNIKIHPSEEYDGLPLAYTEKPNCRDGGSHLYEFEVREKKIEATAFDGEGLVSPAFAEYFRKAIDGYANCFQFRMPFTKGMLFCGRDFHEFFDEFCEEDDPVVTDYLGKKRHLNKAHIIICQTVFKCHEWLRKHCEDNADLISKEYNDDPMRFYFSKLKEYNHAIYISGHNGSMRPDGIESLNYQFLDTLLLSHEDMHKLIADHFEIGLEQLWIYLKPQNNPYDTWARENSKPFIEAASLNPAFYSEELLEDDAIQQLRNLRLDCGAGSLKTQGEHRYLSSDLIAYLIYIVALSYGVKAHSSDFRTDFFDEIYSKIMVLSDRFYMPENSDKPMSLEKDKYYAIFRSPHLSRNEECIMRPYIPTTKDDIYERYFGELTGVIMIPVNSLVPNICSGADFDGDSVKIYSNSVIVNAIKAGVYDENGKRTLPVVDIPVAKEKATSPDDELAFKNMIVNTFSSFIGKLSNLAVTFADKEYNYQAGKILPADSLCAQTTAVTGLEIDSVKNNGKPRENILALDNAKRKYGHHGSTFIKCKEAFKSVRGISYKKISLCRDGRYKFIYSNFEKPLYISKPDCKSHSIMLLPYYCAKMDCIAKDRKFLKDKNYLPSPDKSLKHFTFEDTENLNEDLSKNVLSETKRLIVAYLELNKAVRSYNKSILSLTRSYPKLRTLLALKYDSFDENVRYNNHILDVSIEEALDNSIELISNQLTSSGSAKDAIIKLQNTWLFTASNKRLSVFCSIVGIDDEEVVPDDIKGLLFDFASNGFNILYYIIEMIYSKHLLVDSKDDALKNTFRDKRNLKNKYYKMLLKEYEKAIETEETEAPDKGSSEDDPISGVDPSTPDADLTPFHGWRKKLNELCFIKLKEIVSKDPAVRSGNDTVEAAAVKYAWYCHHYDKIDKHGSFFWDVIEIEAIKECIKIKEA